MFGGWLEWLQAPLALLFMAAAVKLMDDALDAKYDASCGRQTVAAKLGRAALPYALALGLVAAGVDRPLAISVFFGSYAVGMFSTWRERLPTRLPAYAEILIAIGLSCLLVGWRTALWGLATMTFIDWLDDLMDAAGDHAAGGRNVALSLGFVETVFLILAALIAAVLVNATWTVWALVVLGVLTVLSEWTTTCIWSSAEEGKGVR